MFAVPSSVRIAGMNVAVGVSVWVVMVGVVAAGIAKGVLSAVVCPVSPI